MGDAGKGCVLCHGAGAVAGAMAPDLRASPILLGANADAFKTNPDASAEDLVQKMPGVVMENGRVQAQGEDVKEVLAYDSSDQIEQGTQARFSGHRLDPDHLHKYA